MSAKQKNVFFILIVLAMILVYTLSGGSVGIWLDFGEDSLAIAASNYDWIVPYDQIDSMELTLLSDPGTLMEGIEKRTLCCGTWQNDVWGEYTLCVNPKIEQCIVLTMQSGQILAINYENSESTQSLYKMFTDLLNSKGLLK